MADRIPSASSSRRSKASDGAIGQFTIGAEIGKGSFAQVYSGKHQVRTMIPLSRAASGSCFSSAIGVCNRGGLLEPPAPVQDSSRCDCDS